MSGNSVFRRVDAWEHDEAVDAELAAGGNLFYYFFKAEAEGAGETRNGQARAGLRHQEDGLYEVAGGEIGFADLGANGSRLAVAAGTT